MSQESISQSGNKAPQPKKKELSLIEKVKYIDEHIKDLAVDTQIELDGDPSQISRADDARETFLIELKRNGIDDEIPELVRKFDGIGEKYLAELLGKTFNIDVSQAYKITRDAIEKAKTF